MKGLRKFLCSAALRMTILFILNIAICLTMAYFNILIYYHLACLLIALISIFFITHRPEKDLYKAISFLLIFIFPLVGIFYAVTMRVEKGNSKLKKEWNNITYRNRKTIFQNNDTLLSLKSSSIEAYKNTNYIIDSIGMPCYTGINAKYYADGDSYYKDVFEECKKAEKYIFIENYKIVPGEIWSELFNILRLKAREGVSVKIVYDDTVCRRYIPNSDFLKMQNHGIETVPFNQVGKGYNGNFINCRNYKRIFVIDGKVGFIGGFNISDKYKKVNDLVEPTKDCALRLENDAVKNLIVMFIEDYQFATKKVVKLAEYFAEYKPSKHKNWVLPYSKNPVIREHHDKSFILNLINNAKESITVTTSYIALDDELKNALIVNAKSGVKVRLIFGGVNVSKNIKALARSYFYELIKDGVEVYEYKSGKLEAKLIVVDNDTALMSTINLDCSKTYQHFNAGVYMHGEIVNQINKDISNVFINSQLITIKDLQKRKIGEKIRASWLNIIALFR